MVFHPDIPTTLDRLDSDHGDLCFPNDRVETAPDRLVACPVAQHDAVELIEDLGIDVDKLVVEALQQIDGIRPLPLLKIVFQRGVEEDVGVQKDTAIVHGFRPWREWISFLRERDS